MVGWTETGGRPRFSIVTGVSTGALIAPFVYLGPGWDAKLSAVYGGRRSHKLLNWRPLAALLAPSLFSPAPLRKLIDDNTTPEMLRQIAAENASGRRLLVATTDLDAEETVIWDLGALAARGDMLGLKLFREVLLASASVPGVFPPVIIAARTQMAALCRRCMRIPA